MYYKLINEKGKYQDIASKEVRNMIRTSILLTPVRTGWVEYPDNATAMAAFNIELIVQPAEVIDLKSNLKKMDSNQLQSAISIQQSTVDDLQSQFNDIEKQLKQAKHDLLQMQIVQSEAKIKLGGGLKEGGGVHQI